MRKLDAQLRRAEAGLGPQEEAADISTLPTARLQELVEQTSNGTAAARDSGAVRQKPTELADNHSGESDGKCDSQLKGSSPIPQGLSAEHEAAQETRSVDQEEMLQILRFGFP